jgi:predicted ATPase
MRALWPQAKVLDSTLKVSIGEIRKVLGDRATQSQFIETVGTKGYRFIAPISLRLAGNATGSSFSPVVGRASELERLRHHLELANQGKRQLVFVTGEPGIGKTTLVEIFAKNLAANDAITTARGQCIEQYGAGEAYMPILDAVERMCQGSNGDSRVALLRRYAPSWLVNLPDLVSAEERSELQRQSIGITPERRSREIAAFLEALAKEQTVILALEDLHWLDPSSMALISFIACRREAARLMLIGTYRGGEVDRRDHPLKSLKADLELHHYCHHIALRGLSPSAVHEYLTARFETPRVSDRLLSIIYKRSEGNPLFMVNITDYWTNCDGIIRRDNSIEPGTAIDELVTPNTIHQLIERQLDTLPAADQELLKTAGVAGMTFSTAAVAAGLGVSIEEIEIRCDRVAQQEQFLQREGTTRWPDGTVGARYGFTHALYQNVIYESVPASRRARLHQSIGERLEVGYRGSTEDVAAELALHFENAGDYHRAVKYLLASAQIATRQNAYLEAIAYCDGGLARLKSLPKAAQRDELEMSFQLLAGVSLASSKGYASPQAELALGKARRLSLRVSNDFLLFQTLAGLWTYHLLRGELRESLKIAMEMIAIAQRTGNWSFLLTAHMVAGCSRFYLGDLARAQKYFDQSISQYDLERFVATASVYCWDPGITAACYDAMSLWLLGYPVRAEQQAQKALDFARELSSPFHHAVANGMLAMYYAYRRDADATLAAAQTTIAISIENGFSHWVACGTTLKGWAMVRKGNQKEGMIDLTEGIAKWQSTGAQMLVPTYRLLQAEAHLAARDGQKALTLFEQCVAMSQKNHESYYDSELHRLRGEIRLLSKRSIANLLNRQEAEADFLQAIRTAKSQKAKSLELRATTSLCRLWQETGKGKEAKRMLANIYSWFTEGLDTPDLKAAKELLDELR